jgi:anthranilate phosphoribosyltransferase
MDGYTNSLRPVLARLAGGATLNEAEAEAAFALVMDGQASPAQIGALAMALRLRGETVAELTGAARALRARMTRVEADAVAIDVCGTGGDQMNTLNVSTAVTFVAAGAGVRVAKHGNRSASSRSGGADVLAALGVRLEPPLARLPAILAEAALRHAATVRAELGTRTIFNLLGPLGNPAGVTRQLVGVYDAAWTRPMAQVLAALGSARSWVVHGGGLDELSLAGKNWVVAQEAGSVRDITIDAASLGLAPAPVSAIAGGDAPENAECLLALLENRPPEGGFGQGRHCAYRDTVLLNTAAALVVAGLTDDVTVAVTRARAALDSGAALEALNRLRTASEIDE